MADLDLDKLSAAQLGALKMAGGDLDRLPEATLLGIKASLAGDKPSAAAKIADTVNTGVNWLGTQFTKGITGTLGAADTLGDLGKRGAEYVGEKVGAPQLGKNLGGAFKSNMTFGGMAPNAEGMNKVIFGDLGVPEVNAGDNAALTLTPPILGGGKINVGKMLDTGARAIPGMMMLGTGAAPSMLSPSAQAAHTAIPAFTGGVGSEVVGQATAGTPYEFPGRLAGSVGGYVVGSRAVTPLPANLSPEQARAVALAKEMPGMRLSVAQETGRLVPLERGLARFPTSAGPFNRLAGEQGASADAAALMEAGVVGDSVGPEMMKRAANQVGGEFQAAKEGVGTVPLAPSFFDRIKGILADYKGNSSDAGVVPSVQKNVEALTKMEPGKPALTPLTATAARSETPTLARLTQAIEDVDAAVPTGRNVSETLSAWLAPGPKVPMPKAPPELTGDQYQSFRKTVSDTVNDLFSGGKTDAARALQKVRTALDDAAEASLPTEKMEAMTEARRHYANFKIIQKAAARGTAGTRSEGTLSPTALVQELKKSQGDRFSQVTGGLNDIAAVKQYLADTSPNSGTPTTLATQGLVSGAGALMGGGAGALGAGLVPGGIGAVLGGLALPPLLARGLTGGGTVSELIRSYLANQTMTGAPSLGGGMKQLPSMLPPGLAIATPSYPRLERRQ